MFLHMETINQKPKYLNHEKTEAGYANFEELKLINLFLKAAVCAEKWIKFGSEF